MEFKIERTSIWSNRKPLKDERLYKLKIDDKKFWMIEIKTLGELIEFVEKNGSIVIIPPWRESKFYTIEIYDDYRE